MCPAHIIHLDFITRIRFGRKYKSWTSSLCNLLQSPVTSLYNLLQSPVTSLCNLLQSPVTSLCNLLQSPVTSLCNLLQSPVTSLCNLLQSPITSLCNLLQSPVTPFLLCPNIFLRALFKHNESMFLPQYERPGFTLLLKNMLNYSCAYFNLYILGRKLEGRRHWAEWHQAIIGSDSSQYLQERRFELAQ
jgi:hypothetical protein